jgi:helicase
LKSLRRKIESAYRDGWIRVLTATPTLAAGVNLPAEVVVVRDVFRSDIVRGIYRQVQVPSGEILNMLGRAGRPHKSHTGVGVALIEKRFERDPKVQTLRAAIEAGRGTAVRSQLLDSFEGLMRFVLAIVVERGETTREDVAGAFRKTLAHYHVSEDIQFDRAFEEDMMEDIPSYQKVIDAKGNICLKEHRLSPDGVHVEVFSSGKVYQVTLGVTGIECSCPAASRYYRGQVCKHQACAIHDLLFADGIEPEVRTRAIYNCGHVFGRTLDVGTRLQQALEILTHWGMVEHVPGAFRVTKLGEVASTSGLDLLFVRQAVRRIESAEAADYKTVARWAVEDYLAEEKHQDQWVAAIQAWLDEVDVRKISHPARYRGDFEQRVDDLSRVCLLYEKAAEALGKPQVAETAHQASLCLRYGVAPEVVPLMALGFPNLRRARSRYLYDKGIHGLDDLAQADPTRLADPKRVPETFVREWVSHAQEIHQARAVARADKEEADPEFDELISRFRLDPAALS